MTPRRPHPTASAGTPGGTGLRAVRGRRPASRPGRRRPQGDRDRARRRTAATARPWSRAGSASTRSPRPTIPAVGDWVRRSMRDGRGAAPDDAAVIAAVLPRRSAFVRSAADASRRTAGHLVDEQVIAANVDVAFLVAGLDGDFNLRRLERYLAVAWSSGVTPVIVLNKADVARDLDAPARGGRGRRAGVPVVVLSALTGDHVADLAPTSGPGRPRSSSARRASASRRSSTRCSGSSARRRRASGRTTRAAATRRPIASCSRCRAAPS